MHHPFVHRFWNYPPRFFLLHTFFVGMCPVIQVVNLDVRRAWCFASSHPSQGLADFLLVGDGIRKIKNPVPTCPLRGSPNRILSKDQIFVSCSHMTCTLYIMYTIYQFTYFIDVFNHGVTKDPKITLIRYLHQKIQTKHVCNVENNVYLHLNMNRIGFTGEPETG